MNSWISLTIFALFCASSLAQTDQCGNSCGSNQVCVNLGQGYQCAYRLCSDIQCAANQICINNGGVARCVNVSSPSTPAPDPCNNACPSNKVCVNLGSGYQCQYRLCSDIQCEPSQVCINNGGVARCITPSSPASNAAAAASTPAPLDQCNNTCNSDTVCVNLGQGYKCQPRSCSQLQCGSGQVCINDGGVARCITVSQPTANPCIVAVSVNARSGGSFMNNGVPQQVYDLVFTNTGSKSVSSLSVTITPSGAATIPAGQMWNMQPTGSNAYHIDFYNSLPAKNSQYFGAGFILSGTNSNTAPTAVANPTC